MSSSRKTLLPNLERKASLRARVLEPELQESPEPPPKAQKTRLTAPVRVPKRKAGLSPADLTTERTRIPGRAAAYRSLLPMPGHAAASSNAYETMASTVSSSDTVPAKRIKINHDPLLSLKSSNTASELSSAVSMTSASSNPAAERTKKAKYNQKATNRSHIKTSKAEQKDKGWVPSENLNMKSQDFEIPSSNDSMSSRKQSEGLLDERMCVIHAGNDNDYAKFVFTKVEFKSILEKVPHFKTYLATPGSTSINITDFLGSSLGVIIQWITTNVLVDLNPRKLGRRRGLCDYPFVETYTMANTFGLPSMCDEIMDSVLKALWGSKEDGCILPDIRDLYLVYSRTKPGNPLRKLYISIFDWNLISDECNLVRTIPEISSPELWDLLKYSGHAGVDYINYARSQVTDRTFFHPIEPRKWEPCELHQHAITKHCPLDLEKKRRAA